MSEESNHDSGDEESNQNDGDESGSSEDRFEFVDDEDEVDEKVLEKAKKLVLDELNAKTKKNFKDLDGLSKTILQTDEEFRKNGSKQREKSENTTVAEKKPSEDTQKPLEVSNVIKKLYFTQNPDVEFIWDEVVEKAKKLQVDPFELAEDEYYKSKAKMKSEEHKQAEEGKRKVTPPSGQRGGGQPDYTKLSEEEIAKLPLDEFEKASNALAEKSKKGL